MAEGEDGQDKTEDATPERRDEFREKGQVAVSREVSSVFVLASFTGLFGVYMIHLVEKLRHFMISRLEHLEVVQMTEKTAYRYLSGVSQEVFLMIAPVFLATTVAAVFITMSQTRMNWSWKRISPDFNRMNPLSGLTKMVSWESLVELLKSVGKMLIVGGMAFLILKGEWTRVPGLIQMPYLQAWQYWAKITWLLFWSVLGLLIFLAAGDYLFNFISLENKLKMSKQEVKEEYKKRESDPHVKAKIKRMQREIATAKAVQATKTATVVITNPTHFAIAVSYEIGMNAPIVVAKGQDFLAQRMKEVAKESQIPIIENKPLARTLYKICKVGQEIPESLYRAVSEVIRYVFLLKGKSITRKS